MGRGGGGRRHRGRSTAEVAGVGVGVEGGWLAGRHRGGGTQRRGTAAGVGEEVRGRRGWPETSRSRVQRRAGREAGEEVRGIREWRRVSVMAGERRSSVRPAGRPGRRVRGIGGGRGGGRGVGDDGGCRGAAGVEDSGAGRRIRWWIAARLGASKGSWSRGRKEMKIYTRDL